MTAASQWGEAVAAWRRIVGETQVLDDEAHLREYAATTFLTTRRPTAVVRPASADEVADCLQVAQRLGAPLHVISLGHSWGYGSRLPWTDGCAVLDLSRLDRILEVNETFGYAVVEPGVSFGQLATHLSQAGSGWCLSSTGIGSHASVVGNALERGHGLGRNGDHLANSGALEVVLPTGERLRTGFGSYGDGPLLHLYGPGLGPSLEGLLAQSNLGVVTRLTFWLQRRPRFFELMEISLQSEHLGPCVDALRELMAAGAIPRFCGGLFNLPRLLAETGAFPPAPPPGQAVPSDELRRLARQLGMTTPWIGTVVRSAATEGELAATRREIRRRLKGVCVGRVNVLNDRLSRLLRLLRWPAQRLLGLDVEAVLATYAAFRPGAIPSAKLNAPYWRKGHAPAQADPDRDRCGILWVSPMVPFRGEDAAALAEAVEEQAARHGYEPMVNLLLNDERAMSAPLPIYFDRDVPGEDERALAYARELDRRTLALGFYPWRRSQALEPLTRVRDDSQAVLERLRAAVDPAGILSPGRYGLGAAPASAGAPPASSASAGRP